MFIRAPIVVNLEGYQTYGLIYGRTDGTRFEDAAKKMFYSKKMIDKKSVSFECVDKKVIFANISELMMLAIEKKKRNHESVLSRVSYLLTYEDLSSRTCGCCAGEAVSLRTKPPMAAGDGHFNAMTDNVSLSF